MKRTFENEMEKCRILIYGVTANASIKARIAPIYTEERLVQGDHLYQAAKSAAATQGIEKAEGMAATRQYNAARDRIHEGLVKVRQTLRYFFKKELRLLRLLQVDHEIPTNYAQWKMMAETTFSLIQSEADVQQKLALIGITSDVIDNYIDQIDQIDQLRLTAEKEDGEAQQASQQKREAFDELKAFCSDLRECLNLFYQGAERQKLEEVGIVVK